MNSFKNITYSLLAIISFSLVSVGAQAGGISIRIGGYGHGYNGYNPSAYSNYRSPVVIYRNHYQPYYGYRYNSYYGSYGQHYYQGNHRSERHNRRHNSHYEQGSQHHNRRDSQHSGRNRLAGTSNKKHRR